MTARDKLKAVDEIIGFVATSDRETPADYFFGVLDAITAILHADEDGERI